MLMEFSTRCFLRQKKFLVLSQGDVPAGLVLFGMFIVN